MNRIRRNRFAIWVAALAAALSALVQGAAPTQVSAVEGCQLASARGGIQHVIYIQFDNVHFFRDNPNVPSDLEQMPHLLNFITSNGTMLANHHTPLISHTAPDILTSLTGLYGSRDGMPVGNSYRYFNANGTSSSTTSFAYWTDLIGNGTYNMLSAPNTNTPAPWVPYTRAGCNVGVVATANTVLENITVDVDTVFGPNSEQHWEAVNNPTQANLDFVGINVHCAQGDWRCSSANTGMPDLLPSEPGGYVGYQGLFGHRYVAPIISPNGPLLDLFGNPINGFPTFDGMTPAVSLAYAAAMQEHGIPITYAYISDAHDFHGTPRRAYGPGEAGYVAALHDYDAGFAAFFNRLSADGINQSNTLFVVTADEGDHFVGGSPSPVGCDGVTTPCTYAQIGEINTNLTGLLATQQGITTTFAVHADSAPTIYLDGNPARTALVKRNFDRAVGRLTAVNPLTGQTENITQYLADPVEMALLHMITSDPARTPTLTQFALPDYFLFAGPPNCTSPCVALNPAFAWNHGDAQEDIVTTWLGMVGPGVRAQGVDTSTWSDQTDVRPTMMMLLGLQDDYAHDGRALTEPLYASVLPQSLRAHRETVLRLAQVYKQLNATVGPLGLDSLRISTRAMESGTPADDSTYTNLENQLIGFTAQRDSLAAQMASLLRAATFGNQSINERQARSLISQGQALLAAVHALAGQ